MPHSVPSGPQRQGPARENRLATERSPYLRQHRYNPVDWYPWGPEALARAQREGRPLFLSVGYAACHWCHVMEHECFEDEETARLLNATFVCVKVDREERPDIDRVYMAAVQLLTGRGGWPMTVLLTPDGRPFWGGTYLPRENLQDLVARVEVAWRTRREALDQQANHIALRVREALSQRELPPVPGTDAEVLERLETSLAASFDARHGGYGGRPKFPPHAELLLQLDRAGAAGGARGLAMARTTLERMEEGGIHDHVGGGFHRYATDEIWLVPHFEKMLYDNALLAQAYAGMFAHTREPRFARTARRLLEWVERDLRRPGGGYASSLDADTEGEEGLTYTWTPDEVRALLNPVEAALVLDVLAVRPGGNYDEEASGQSTGRNIPHLAQPLAQVASARGVPEHALRERLDAALATLRVARDRRPQPGLDDKVIAAWNGLLLSGLARAAHALSEPVYLARARELAEFLLREHRDAAGLLLRFPRGSGPALPGFCEDHVHVAEGLLDLGEVAREPRYLLEARRLADALLERFEDGQGGGFWATSEGTHETLLARAKEVWDNPIPSDNGTAVRLLLRLAAATGQARYRQAADRALAAYRPLLGAAGTARGVVALCRALALRMTLPAPADADADPGPGDARVRQGVAEVDAYLERNEAAVGSSVRFALRVRLDPGWHVNATAPPPGREASELALGERAPVILGPCVWPTPVDLGPGVPPGYAGTFWVRGEVQVPPGAAAGPRRWALVLTLQPCDATSCRPSEQVRLDLPLRFGGEDGPKRHPAVFR